MANEPVKKRNRSVRRDVIVCLLVALFIATSFSGCQLARYIFDGDRPFEGLGTTLGALILLYFTAAIVVGPLVGLLLPLARTGRAGAAVVGTVAFLPYYAVAVVTVEGFVSWTAGKALFRLIPAVIVGAPVGVMYRRMFGDL